MSQSVMYGDYLFANNVQFAGTMTIPASSVSNAKVASDADIDASKLEHQFHSVYAQANGTNNTAKRQGVCIVNGTTGTIVAVRARNTTAASGGDKTTVDVYKNGVTILSAVIALDASASTTVQSGTLSVTTLAVGDVLEVVTALTGTNVGQGVTVDVVTREDAA